MNLDDYRNSSAGRLIQQGEGPGAFWAFVPNALPPTVEVDWKLAGLQGEAERAVGELAGLGSNLINPRLLIAPLMGREAVLSSRIEGTQTGVADLICLKPFIHLWTGMAGLGGCSWRCCSWSGSCYRCHCCI